MGDRVEIKRKTGWMAGEIEQITPSMYGRTTYTVWIDGQNDWEYWVPAHELRPQRGITKEIAGLLMENRELKGRLGVSRTPREPKREQDERSFAKPGRAYRGRRDYAGSVKAAPRGPSRDYHREAQSEMGHDAYYPDHRGGSMPAGNYSYTWPEFIADLTHAVYNRDKEGDGAQSEAPEEAEPAPPKQDAYDDHKKDADDYDTRDRDREQYDDDPAYNNPRALMQDTKNGGNQASDEVIFQGKHERMHPQNYGSQGPLIYVNYMMGAPSEHGHAEPYSNRNDRYDNYATPGH